MKTFGVTVVAASAKQFADALQLAADTVREFNDAYDALPVDGRADAVSVDNVVEIFRNE